MEVEQALQKEVNVMFIMAVVYLQCMGMCGIHKLMNFRPSHVKKKGFYLNRIQNTMTPNK